MFLHGTGGTADWADADTTWTEAAGRDGFVLALPAQHTRASLRCVRPGGAVDTAWVIL